MSVLKKDRKESKLQVWDTAQKLKLSLTYVLMKDFGTKAKVKDVDWITQGMSNMDKERHVISLSRLESSLNVFRMM